ncbi:MAG: selenoneine biosynthesis selenosugar synthase SenB [Burkholderiaceae bacterium]|jgi:putative glycosyltransferase (TIGR04348 family)
MRETVVIVTPALQKANNGNWRTAERWARFLSARYVVELVSHWSRSEKASRDPGLLIALHARRSAESIHAWSHTFPLKPVVTVLTGTDLYPDIRKDLLAMQSLTQSTALVVLQEQGISALPSEFQSKAAVIYQSGSAWKPREMKPLPFTLRMVGHLRQEKSPETFMQLAQQFEQIQGIRFELVGGAIDPELGELASRLALQSRVFVWTGALSYRATRSRIRDAHLLVHPSRLEGGAHAILEAAMSGTPVLASRVPGNVGMLGSDYLGYFEHGNVEQLKQLVGECQRSHQTGQGLYGLLLQQVHARCALFHPTHERKILLQFVKNLLPS